MRKTLVWKDSRDGASSVAATPELGKGACFKVVGSMYWFHPSFDAPRCAGNGWFGDLSPGKAAAEAEYQFKQVTVR